MADFIKNKALRKLYYSGEHQLYHITITDTTKEWLKETVPVGKGKYGSAFTELALRLLLSLLDNGEDLDIVLQELDDVQKSPYLEGNVKRLAAYFNVL